MAYDGDEQKSEKSKQVGKLTLPTPCVRVVPHLEVWGLVSEGETGGEIGGIFGVDVGENAGEPTGLVDHRRRLHRVQIVRHGHAHRCQIIT